MEEKDCVHSLLLTTSVEPSWKTESGLCSSLSIKSEPQSQSDNETNEDSFEDKIRCSELKSEQPDFVIKSEPLDEDQLPTDLSAHLAHSETVKKSHSQKNGSNIPSAYQCVKRHQSFSELPLLVEHQKIHCGRKPHQCELCGRGFDRVCHLIQHIRTHTGEKPYKCVECGKGFSRPNNLVQHMRVHTGEKPYKCDKCGKAFAHSVNLLRHKRCI